MFPNHAKIVPFDLNLTATEPNNHTELTMRTEAQQNLCANREQLLIGHRAGASASRLAISRSR
jgi:hypothetical protein